MDVTAESVGIPVISCGETTDEVFVAAPALPVLRCSTTMRTATTMPIINTNADMQTAAARHRLIRRITIAQTTQIPFILARRRRTGVRGCAPTWFTIGSPPYHGRPDEPII